MRPAGGLGAGGLSRYPALETILVSYPISWGVTSALYLVYYFRGNWLRRGIARAGFPAEAAPAAASEVRAD